MSEIFIANSLACDLRTGPDGRFIALTVQSGEDEATFELNPEVIDHLIADLRALRDEMIRISGLESVEDERLRREEDRQLRAFLKKKEDEQYEVERRRLQAEAKSCFFCHRPISLYVEGVAYCKRHAEEHGVRPHGKIA